jgi:hypothetical protein
VGVGALKGRKQDVSVCVCILVPLVQLPRHPQSSCTRTSVVP